MLNAEIATHAKLYLVDCLIVFFAPPQNGVFTKINNAFMAIVHNILYKTFFRYDIAGRFMKVFEIT